MERVRQTLHRYPPHWEGAHGLLGLGLTPVTYQQITANTFARLGNPGLLPRNVVGTSAQMAEIVRQHKEELRVFRQVTATDLALKSQLLDVFKDILPGST